MNARTAKTKTFARAAFFIAILTELSITSYIGIKTTGTTDRNEYYDGYEQVKALLNTRKKTDVDFYRTDLNSPYNNNQPYLYNYNGISFFSTAINLDVHRFMQGLGLNCSRSQYNTNAFFYGETSPLTNAFLNMRYLIGPTGGITDKNVYWEIIGKIGDLLLLENKYYLPLGFMVDNKLADYKHHDDPFLAQNALFQLATGLDGDLFEKHEFNISDPRKNDYNQQILKWNFQFLFNGMAYAYCWYDDIVFRDYSRTYSFEIDLNKTETEPVQLYVADNVPYIFPVGNITQNDNITFSVEINNNENKALIAVGLLNSELFEQGYAKLASQVLQLTEFTNTKVKGKITVLDDGLLYTSIPADRNWSAYVDGVKREIVKIDNAMLAVSLSKGHHEIEFRYFNTSLLAGGIVSLVSLAIFIALAVFETRKHRSSET
jgi:uncharacterized membrane protein YfhO